MSIYISNPKEVERKIGRIKKDGLKNLQILTDFDRTLTKAFVDGEPTPSIMKLLRSGTYISPQYNDAADALSKKYYPIEINLTIPYEERRKAMEEWWTTHFDLLIKSGLNKKHLEQMVLNEKLQFREGALEMVDYLHQNNIPLVIISSSGLGETIPMLLKKHRRLYDNVHVITNEYVWDSNGNAKGMQGPTIHVMNKDESALKTLPVFETIAHRKNVILLGDSIDDLKMIGDFKYNNLLTLGFLDANVHANRPAYQKAFDVVLEGNETFDYINELMEKIK